jgi:hypothetical protein
MVVLVAILVGLLIIDDKNKKFVLKNSERIKNLIALNATIYFSILQPSYSNHQVCNSKRQLENFSINNYLIVLTFLHIRFY